MRQYAAALDGFRAQTTDIGAERTIPGSFNALVVSYYRSPEFRELAEISQRNRRNVIERFRAEHGDKPIARLERAHIQNFISAKANTPAAANVLLKTLRLLLNHAVFIGMIPTNSAVGVRGFRSKSDGHHTWTEEEVAQFVAHIRQAVRRDVRFAFCSIRRSASRMSLAWAGSTFRATRSPCASKRPTRLS